MDARPQDGISQNIPDDNEHSNAFINQRTAIVKASARNTPLTPPRKKIVFGLPTPPSPDSHPRPYFYFTSPTPPSRNILNDTKFLTSAGEPSEQFSDECTDSNTSTTLSPSAGIPTPDSTPTRRLICQEETIIKSESSYSLETSTRSVVESTETSLPAAEILRNKLSGISETAPTASTPRYTDIVDSDSELYTRCRGITLRGAQCKRRVNSPTQHCYQHIHVTHDTPIALTVLTSPALQYTAELDTQCHGTTLRGTRCKRRVNPPTQHCYQHFPATHNTTITPTALTSQAGTFQYILPTAELDTRCRGITLRGARCKRRVNPPTQHCYQHIPVTHDTPIALTVLTSPALQYTAELDTQCHGTTLRGARCKRRVNPPIQHCYQHIPVTHDAPITLTALTSPAGTLQYTLPTPGLDMQCNGITLRGARCKRRVNPPIQHCYQHIPATHDAFISAIHSIPTTPTRVLVQCSADASVTSTGHKCRQQTSIYPGQPKDGVYYCNKYSPKSATPNDPGFRVQRPGREEAFVYFHDHIPQYLQLITQQKLRKAICEIFSKKIKKPGYVYALNVADPEQEGEVAWKVGYSKDVEKRAQQWKGHSHITDLHWQWPQAGTTIKHEDNKASIQNFIAHTRQRGDVCSVAEQLERLVHLELRDLATHEAYLHVDWPDIKYSDVPRKSKVVYKPCSKCSPTRHKEIFSFRRVKKGVHLGKEWEDIVEPVIRRWGHFLMKYFPEEG